MGRGWARMGKDGQGWAGMGKDGQGWARMGRDGQGSTNQNEGPNKAGASLVDATEGNLQK